MSAIRRAAGLAKTLVQRGLATAGVRQTEARIAADAQDYWNEAGGDRWKSDSHWLDGDTFSGGELWWQIGRRHLDMVERGARMLEFDRPWGTVVEWGCGGGANAVHFAKKAKEFIGVDVAPESLEECGGQVAAQSDTPYRPVLVDVARPEEAVPAIGREQCDIFLCVYVFELVPTPEYGERLLRIARDLLTPGGIALIQVKYDEGGFWTRPRRRSYRSGVAEMTTYPISGFWQLAVKSGLQPESVMLVPENELDRRYAYFLLSKP